MKKRIALSILLSSLIFSLACGEKGLITKKSSTDVKTTIKKLEKIVTQKGMKVFARIDHAAGAIKAGKTLRPTELIIFGNPKIGTLLMQCSQSTGIDLPQKVLVWQDASGTVWITYNDPAYLAKRHGLQKCSQVITKITGVLDTFTTSASKR